MAGDAADHSERKKAAAAPTRKRQVDDHALKSPANNQGAGIIITSQRKIRIYLHGSFDRLTAIDVAAFSGP
jgi:hypothetical protein